MVKNDICLWSNKMPFLEGNKITPKTDLCLECLE